VHNQSLQQTKPPVTSPAYAGAAPDVFAAEAGVRLFDPRITSIAVAFGLGDCGLGRIAGRARSAAVTASGRERRVAGLDESHRRPSWMFRAQSRPARGAFRGLELALERHRAGSEGLD
jgi:hypothetical protein